LYIYLAYIDHQVN